MITKAFNEVYYYGIGDFWLDSSNSLIDNPLNVASTNDLKHQIYTYCGIAKASQPTEWGASEVITLFKNYVFPDAWELSFIRSESEDRLNNEDVKRFLYEVGAWISSTYPYYKQMLDLYTAQQSHLMDSLGATDTLVYNNEQAHGVTKFNDMPQTTATVQDDHLSNLTDNTNTMTGGHTNTHIENVSIIQRLEEIAQNFRRLFQEWADEFIDKFAIYEI